MTPRRQLRFLFLAGLLTTTISPLGAAEPPPEPKVIRGPYLQRLLGTSVLVVWLTDLPSAGRVRYAREDGRFLERREPAPGTSHRLSLGGLSPGTTYRYEVLDGDRLLASHRFRTAPPEDRGSFRAAVIGDSGTLSEAQYRVAALLETLQPDILIHTGDLDYVGDEDLSIFGPYRTLLGGASIYPTRGNHDDVFPWRELFHLDWAEPPGKGDYYSFDFGSAHFASLDTNEDPARGFEKDSDQFQWLAADVKAARSRKIPWVILFFHRPVHSVGAYVAEAFSMRSRIAPVVEELGVDLVLSGHDHNYQRTHPVRGEMRNGRRSEVVRDAWQSPHFASPRAPIYLVTGGGGAILYTETTDDHRYVERFRAEHHALEITVEPTRLSVKALSPDLESPGGRVIDSFTIEKGAARPELVFRRGDVDLDGEVDITDSIAALHHLFLGSGPLQCPLTGDADGSGLPIDLADPIHLLGHLFLGGSPPPFPFPECGAVPEPDDSFCMRAACEG